MATEITYNGTTIASLAGGQAATLSCAGKKAKSNIAVAFGSAGKIAYNGVETAVLSGKTVTLPCGGKKMKTDVTVTVAASAPTHALYNGVKLPVIPASVLSQKAYWMILYRMLSDEYYLYGSTNPWYFFSTDAHPSTVDNAGDKCYRYLATANSWSLVSNSYSDYLTLGSINEVLWSNHNMPNGSATATEIYFLKTEPVPIL